MNCENCDKLQRELLSALTAIEKHNDFWKNPAFQVDQIEVDLSLLHEHDAEVHARGKNEGWNEGREHERKCAAEVRKPLVDALAKVEQ